MGTLQIDPDLPEITPAQSLTGWRREFCIELLGDGAARIFARSVEQASFKAAELQCGILYCRLDSRFADLAGCVQSPQPDLELLADTARRTPPSEDNLFSTVAYHRDAWDSVQRGIDRWRRR